MSLEGYIAICYLKGCFQQIDSLLLNLLNVSFHVLEDMRKGRIL